MCCLHQAHLVLRFRSFPSSWGSLWALPPWLLSWATFGDRSFSQRIGISLSSWRWFFSAWPDRGQYKDQLISVLKLAYLNFNSWKKRNKLRCTQPRFTPARLNRTSNRQTFPCLSSKAATSKILTYWLADLTKQHSDKTSATELDREVAVCMWAYARSLQVLDGAGMLMKDDEKRAFFDMVLLHLQTYAHLHKKSSVCHGGKSQPVTLAVSAKAPSFFSLCWGLSYHGVWTPRWTPF